MLLMMTLPLCEGTSRYEFALEPMSSDALLMGGIAFVTSTLTGVVGLGGGLLLLAMLPGFLPLSALIPVHGVVQMASNTSRALFAIRAIEWRICAVFAVGACAGALGGSRLVLDFPTERLPLLLGVFMLIVTWVPIPKTVRTLPGRFLTLGAALTFLSLFVGATGPVSAPVLLKEGLPRDHFVATHAVMLTTVHVAKLLTFGLLGFAFGPFLGMMATMAAGAIAGSWVGTRLRHLVPETGFRRLVKLLITVLALRMLVMGSL